MNEIFNYAVKLLAIRDYSVASLREKLAARFGDVPAEVLDQWIDRLSARRYLDDRRFAENYALRRRDRGAPLLRQELMARGIPPELAEEVVLATDWPSLRSALTAKLVDWNLRPPLQTRDAARLFRALARLGYEEDSIRGEIEQLHEQ